MKYASFWFLFLCTIILIGVHACTTPPLLVEVPGAPLPVGQDTIILLTESNLCETDVISFQREILPIMVSGCAYSGCHDAGTAEDDIVLESYQQIRSEVTPGDPNDSEIYKSITDNPNDEDFMPPSPAIALSSEQITVVRKWIEQGAQNTDCNVPCNSENTSFSADIYPLIENQCLGCHQPTNSLGGVNLVDYVHIRGYAANGSLTGTMKHTAGFFAMPPTGNKMTDCQIAQVQNWITEGALNN